MAGKNQHVVPHNGKWAVRVEGSKRVSSVYDTKQEAIDAARSIARIQAGKIVVHGRSGQIFQKSDAQSRVREDKIREVVRAGGLDGTRLLTKKPTKKSNANSRYMPKH